jgi:hypothetical protein
MTPLFIFDRHLLILAPVGLLLFCAQIGGHMRIHRYRFGLVLLPLVFYSVAGTHDIHSISRAAYEMGNRLVQSGIDPMWIDAGYAFDGWTMYERSRSEKSVRFRDHDGWWVRQLDTGIYTRYVVTLSPEISLPELGGFWRKSSGYATPDLNNYEVIDQSTYRTYWPFKIQNVYLMRERSELTANSEKGGNNDRTTIGR